MAAAAASLGASRAYATPVARGAAIRSRTRAARKIIQGRRSANGLRVDAVAADAPSAIDDDAAMFKGK